MAPSKISYCANAIVSVVLWLLGFNMSCHKHCGIVFTERRISAHFLKSNVTIDEIALTLLGVSLRVDATLKLSPSVRVNIRGKEAMAI